MSGKTGREFVREVWRGMKNTPPPPHPCATVNLRVSARAPISEAAHEILDIFGAPSRVTDDNGGHLVLHWDYRP